MCVIMRYNIFGNSGISMESSDRVNLGITLQRSVLEQLDVMRGDVPRSRAIERAVKAKLGIKQGPGSDQS
jgi:hypothetical protein